MGELQEEEGEAKERQWRGEVLAAEMASNHPGGGAACGSQLGLPRFRASGNAFESASLLAGFPSMARRAPTSE